MEDEILQSCGIARCRSCGALPILERDDIEVYFKCSGCGEQSEGALLSNAFGGADPVAFVSAVSRWNALNDKKAPDHAVTAPMRESRKANVGNLSSGFL